MQKSQRRDDPGVVVSGELLEKKAGLGNNPYEGAERLGQELGSWRAPSRSADAAVLPNRDILEARGQDLMRNHGNLVGASNTHKDSIIGAHYRLNAKPKWRTLGLSDAWADEFAEEVEETFTLYAESDAYWIDASARCTLTELCRLGIGVYFVGGEVVGTMNWLKGDRPFQTAFQMIDAKRLSNPNDKQDSDRLRRGVHLGPLGEPIGFSFRKGFVNDLLAPVADAYRWEYWPIRKRWGRLQVLHIQEMQRPGQNRGLADMVSILKETRMGKRFHELSLENAIVQASYAAAIESELPPEAAMQMIGAVQEGREVAAVGWLQALSEYTRGGRALEINGIKVPYLFPGSKLHMMSPDRPEGVGGEFEESLNRLIASGLGVSYEELTRDFTKTNYSSARAAANNTMKFMRSRKRMVADKIANSVYQCWLEEAINKDLLRTTRELTRKNSDWFYQPLFKEAVSHAHWIGSSRGQVDELKETQASVMRIAAGLSTLEIECAVLGNDYRDIIIQRVKEMKLLQANGLTLDLSAAKSGTLSSQKGKESSDQTTDNNEDDDGLDD